MSPLFVLALLGAGPPAAEEHFRHQDVVTSHVLLIVDTRDGHRVRADGLVAGETETAASGELAWVLLALTALEQERLGPETTIACDSLCWTRGRHGRPTVVEALAIGCEAFFERTRGMVSERAIESHARRAGFAPEEAPGDDPGRFDSDWPTSARQWVEFWSRLSRGEIATQVGTASTILGAAALAVSSPRGVARALRDQDPRTRARALAGASADGAWITGTFEADDVHRWAFALFLRDGTVTLAADRAARLLDETLTAFRLASSERGGPLPPLRED